MKSKIISSREVTRGYFQMEFEFPAAASPGQFIMMKTAEHNDPLLRRPMSIAGLDGGVMSVIFKVVGRGTGLLAEKQAGEHIDVIGPFGSVFNPPENETALLVGGGIGIAPLLFWAKRNPLRKAAAFIGGATENDILRAEEFSEVHIVTENGSRGRKGLVTAPLVEHDAYKNKTGYILACGPTGMLKAVDALCARHGMKGELSLEERMGCGFGVCLGCVCDTTGGRKRMCVEGPVFKTGEVLWRT